MCLAIYKPANVSIPADALRCGWVSNPDGAGYAFASGGKLHVRKGFMKFKEFEEAYKTDAASLDEFPAVVHFRIRSMGDKSADNTHPFEIADGVMIHNGTLDGTGANYNIGASDTKKFADMFGKDLTFDFCTQNKLLLSTGLSWNKLVMLYKDGSHVIINEDEGTWDKQVWYSNKSYNPRPPGVPGYNASLHDDAGWDRLYD